MEIFILIFLGAVIGVFVLFKTINFLDRRNEHNKVKRGARWLDDMNADWVLGEEMLRKARGGKKEFMNYLVELPTKLTGRKYTTQQDNKWLWNNGFNGYDYYPRAEWWREEIRQRRKEYIVE